MTWASPEFDAALKLGTTFVAYAIRIERADGGVFGATNIRRPVQLATLTIPIRPNRNVVVPATAYSHRAALRVSNVVKSDSPSQVDNMEATFCMGDVSSGAVLSEADVWRGRYENARFHLLVFDWKKPLGDDGTPRAMLLLRGHLGARTVKGRDVTWSLRSLVHRLKGEVLEVTSRDSRARWGDPELASFNLDGNCADGPPARRTAAVSEVDSAWPRRRFRLPIGGQYPDARFEDGIVLFQSGANAGFETGVLAFDPSTGWFTTTTETPAPIAPGQSVRAQIRAPRTLAEFQNILGSGRYAALEPLIPTRESANRIR